MTATSNSRQFIHYPNRTVKRAEQAMLCAPFTLKLFDTMVWHSVSLKTIAGSSGVQHHYTKASLSELSAENELLWLIQVGLLRREVDGQGLTDSFRVTPLGRQLVQQWQNGENLIRYAPTWRDRCSNAVNRWFRLPI